MGRGGGGRLFEVGANSRLGAYSNKYGISSFFFNFLPVSSPDALSVGRSQQYWSGYRYDFTPPLNVYRIARRFVLVLV